MRFMRWGFKFTTVGMCIILAMNEETEIKDLYRSLKNKRSMLNMLRSERYVHLKRFLDRNTASG